MSLTKQTLRMSREKPIVQKNHAGCVVPASVKKWAHLPMYQLIALWCLQQKRWVDRDEIADAFRIDKRRASFLMSYILGRPARIHCQAREIPRVDSHYSLHTLLVENVILDEVPAPARTPIDTTPKCRRVGNGAAEDWQWLLRRAPPK
ncbi:LEE type III secretion system transcriptional regulator GrlA [Enterobacterales bacterium CwR94]|nr:LEE type III secretion system transcriptional regulator GrlA [Enterobacterales bacterium CwR94]